MPTVTVHMKEQDAELIRTFADVQGVTISNFARSAILEKIEDSYDLRELREAITKDSGGRFGVDENLADLTWHPWKWALATSSYSSMTKSSPSRSSPSAAEARCTATEN